MDHVKNLPIMVIGLLPLVLGLLVATGCSQEMELSVDDGVYRLYFIADPHLVDPGDEMYLERKNALRHFVDAVNQDPDRDLAFNLGDSSQASSNQGLLDTVELWGQIEGTEYLQSQGIDCYPWFALGNHETFVLNRMDVAHLFCQTQTVEGGSPWNGQFTYNRLGYGLHFIMMDCMFDKNNRPSTSKPRLHDETVLWLENILLTTESNMAILMSHAMPHFYEEHGEYYWGDEAQAWQLSRLVEMAIDHNEALEKVVWFAGHWHGSPVGTTIEYTNLGSHLVGYRIPPAQDGNRRHGEKGVYSVVEIDQRGQIGIEDVITPAAYGGGTAVIQEGAPAGVSLARNPDFLIGNETGLPDGWVPSQNRPEYVFGVEPDAGYQGGPAVFISSENDERWPHWNQELELSALGIRPGQRLHLGAWIKTDAVSNGSDWTGATVIGYIYDKDGGLIAHARSHPYLSGTNDWTYFSPTFAPLEVPDGAYTIRIALQLSIGTGTVWFDQVQLIIED